MVIRPAAEADIEVLAAIHAAAFWSNINQLELGSHDHLGYHDLIAENALKEAKACWQDTTVAVLGGQPVGVCTLSFQPPLLSDLWVLPERQGFGVGTLLINEAIGRFKARGATFVQLDVHRLNPAKRLYERAGFEVTEETTRRSTALNRDIPIFIMRLKI